MGDERKRDPSLLAAFAVAFAFMLALLAAAQGAGWVAHQAGWVDDADVFVDFLGRLSSDDESVTPEERRDSQRERIEDEFGNPYDDSHYCGRNVLC